MLERFASSRASQAWYMDFAIALLLFTFTLAVYFSYTNNFQKQEKGELESLLAEAKTISTSLVRSGYPNDWDSTNVIRIGIADDYILNITKLANFNDINYNNTKRKFGIVNDYTVFFTNASGDLIEINNICGLGISITNRTYNVRSAYYYQNDDDSFLKDFMVQTFKADIYFGDYPNDVDDIDGLVSNLSKYSFVVLEHPLLSGGNYNDFKDLLNDYVSEGGLFMVSGELTTSQGRNLVGADFYKKSGQSTSDRNAIVNNSDQYLSLTVGENIVFRQAYYVQNTPEAIGFKQIATFNQDQRNALSRWEYGNGTVYFFSDFDVSYFNGNFLSEVEEAAKKLVPGICNFVNLTTINPKKLVKTERYLNYDTDIIRMVVYVWE